MLEILFVLLAIGWVVGAFEFTVWSLVLCVFVAYFAVIRPFIRRIRATK